jgi:hypothetical protein
MITPQAVSALHAGGVVVDEDALSGRDRGVPGREVGADLDDVSDRLMAEN